MKMLIAFQKNSQNREATQAGGLGRAEGGCSLETKRDFTIQ